jgi:hypothetical protein
MKKPFIYFSAGIILAVLIYVIFNLLSEINNLQRRIDFQENLYVVVNSKNHEEAVLSPTENPVQADLYRFLEGQLDPSSYEISYQGIMWSSLFNSDLGYFLPLLDRILFSKEYVWMEEIDSTSFANTMNSLDSIRAEGKKVEELIIGFVFQKPINSIIKGLSSDIIELWVALDNDKCILNTKNKDNIWLSYEVMGDEFFLERRLMKQLIISLREKQALETP